MLAGIFKKQTGSCNFNLNKCVVGNKEGGTAFDGVINTVKNALVDHAQWCVVFWLVIRMRSDLSKLVICNEFVNYNPIKIVFIYRRFAATEFSLRLSTYLYNEVFLLLYLNLNKQGVGSNCVSSSVADTCTCFLYRI